MTGQHGRTTWHDRRRRTLRLLAVSALATAGFAAAWGTASGSTTHDIRGTYAIDVCPGAVSGTCTVNNFPQTWTITSVDLSTGAVSGSGSGGGQTFTITGTANGDALNLKATERGYSSQTTATISADSNSFTGTYTDSNHGKGTVTGTRTSPPPPPTTTTTTTTTKRPSVTHVMCDYTFADERDVCTALVGDATGRAAQPTGLVTFSSTIPGTTFSGGGSCTLAQQVGDVGVSSCSVTYEGPQTQSLEATVTYHGDATFQPSSGSTQFLLAGQGANAYAPTIQNFNPPTLNATVNVPPGGATLTTVGDVTSDLTQQAVCQADPAQSENTDAVRGGIEAFSARAKSPPRSVRVRLVRRYKHGGKVRVALRFNAPALARAFPRTTRVQVIVGVTIRSPRGGTVSLYRRNTVVLHRHGGTRNPARGGPHRALDAAALAGQAAAGSHTWHGSSSCGSLDVTVGPGVSAQVTITWHAQLNVLRTPVTFQGGVYATTLTATTTATVVARGVYSFRTSGNQDGVDFQISGQVRTGASGTATGSGTASGGALFIDPQIPSHPFSASAPSTLAQTS
jgi:hypothetical protein